MLEAQAPSITILFPLDANGQQGHTAQCTAIEGAVLSRGQLLNVIHHFYQVKPGLHAHVCIKTVSVLPGPPLAGGSRVAPALQ